MGDMSCITSSGHNPSPRQYYLAFRVIWMIVAVVEKGEVHGASQFVHPIVMRFGGAAEQEIEKVY
jgi:hypothetical protein